MRNYELIVVLSPILSQEDVTGSWERIKDIIVQHDGQVTEEEQWGMRRLAYPIKKEGQTFLEGNYLLARFSTDTRLPSELEAQLKLSENVLRFLVVRWDATKITTPRPKVIAVAQAGEPVAEVAAVKEDPAAVAEEPVVGKVEEPEAGEAVVEAGGPVAEVAAVEEVPAAEAEEPVVGEVEEPEAEEAVAEAGGACCRSGSSKGSPGS